jgi:hypothetical protein
MPERARRETDRLAPGASKQGGAEMKLHIKRQRNIWIAEQNGVMVEWAKTFHAICFAAGMWQRNGWIVGRDWPKP